MIQQFPDVKRKNFKPFHVLTNNKVPAQTSAYQRVGLKKIYQVFKVFFHDFSKEEEKKLSQISQGEVFNDSPANGTVCISDLEGCGAVEYMYLKSWST